jgi:aryl-alcohol dehydrogenase-like predicted oxidoreductase
VATALNSYGPTEDATSLAALETALDLGCNFFDTADVYGYGHSEDCWVKHCAPVAAGPGAAKALLRTVASPGH